MGRKSAPKKHEVEAAQAITRDGDKGKAARSKRKSIIDERKSKSVRGTRLQSSNDMPVLRIGEQDISEKTITSTMKAKKVESNRRKNKKNSTVSMPVQSIDGGKTARKKRKCIIDARKSTAVTGGSIRASTTAERNVGFSNEDEMKTPVHHVVTNDLDITKKRKFTEAWTFGEPSCSCPQCGAILWYEERANRSEKGADPRFSICCQEGKVDLPLLKPPPAFLHNLLNPRDGRQNTKFKDNIRSYNSIFAFTSMGANVDNSINNGSGPYIFRINGQNHHKIGSLLPASGQKPKFAQLYIYDTENEVSNRMNAVNNKSLDPSIVEGLLKMFDSCNQLTKVFRMARDRFRESDFTTVRIKLIGSHTKDARQYNAPVSSEVAALVVGDMDGTTGKRDVIVEHRSLGLQRISEIHPSFMAMQYPILFPYGESGYEPGIPYKSTQSSRKRKRQHVTMREYYSFRIQQRRHEGQTVVSGGRLFQQYIVDAYTATEEDRLRWIRRNQPQLRAELYKGICDAVVRGDTAPALIGRRIVLPSSFTGGPRYMMQNYQDAIAICRWIGHPHLFLTFTANPKWDEVQRCLQHTVGQIASDRPDIQCRVFKIKLQELMSDLTRGRHFGKVMAAVYTIEFQKRGLPHAHILLWLHRPNGSPTTSEIDRIISAEIPDGDTDPVGYTAVSQFMIHGPCGLLNQSAPCMINGSCDRKFPKKFQNETTIDGDGFPVYRRRENNRYVQKENVKLDNRYVVPHNMDLIIKYQAHINVEWCNQSRSIKYLFKYIIKGPDRTTMVVEENISADVMSSAGKIIEVDEIKNYLDCRYVSACEACWRIYQFDIHYHRPAVERLTFHLPDEQSVTFRDSESLPEILNREDIQKTMFTEWMLTNATNEEAQSLTYVEFPSKFVWRKKQKKWRPRKGRRSIGRIIYAHPSSGERFYLRMLLNIVKGPRSFEEIRTINGTLHTTFKSACYALGLLDDDKEWHDALNEAAEWASARQLRELFVTLLLFCEVSNPVELWRRNWELLSDDIVYQQRRRLCHPELHLTEFQIENYTLLEVEKLLVRNGRSLNDFTQMPLPDKSLLKQLNNRLISEETCYNIDALTIEHHNLLSRLNAKQKRIYNEVVKSATERQGGLFFIYGHGGTGKTYLYRTIMARLRAEQKIVLAVASSGIAALLLSGGRTAHSRFHIPIGLSETSTCAISQGTQLANLICRTSLIIWDEAPVDHRHAFEAVDRTLRDILRSEDPNSDSKPFGGITVLLGGDFRQILPVIPRGRREDIVMAALNRSPLWDSCKLFTLTENMRLHQQQDSSTLSVAAFSKWILDVGDGKADSTARDGDTDSAWIKIPESLLLHAADHPIAEIVSSTFPDFLKNHLYSQYLQERAILTPTNETADDINTHMLQLVPGEENIYLSSDSICKASSSVSDQDVLYPVEFLNSLKFPGLPNHRLHLKVGVPIMLLRNIDQSAGLCNGTRLMVTQLAVRVIEARIVTGSHVGTKVLIPRIIMSPTESKWPFILKRKQFPVKICYAMTINKSQGQTMQHVGLYLDKPVFSHGQLYVALSRVTSPVGLRILIDHKDIDMEGCTKNIVYKEVFNNLSPS